MRSTSTSLQGSTWGACNYVWGFAGLMLYYWLPKRCAEQLSWVLEGAHPPSKPPVTFNFWLVRDFTFPFTPLFEAAIGDVCDYKTGIFACGKVAYRLLLQDEGVPFDCAWEELPAFLEAWSPRESVKCMQP